MADFCADSEIVKEFLFNTCGLRQKLNTDNFRAVCFCAFIESRRLSPNTDDETDVTGGDTIPVTCITGSVAEFYIQPMLSCVGDFDIMFYPYILLAIPAGTAPPTQLPDEFHSCVHACEIVDSGFPGYVYLVTSYTLTECTDCGKYTAVECPRLYLQYEISDKSHGPATVIEWSETSYIDAVRLAGSRISRDLVMCLRCLSWPSQAADWPTRHRKYGWPDSATIDCVVSNGCDVVRVAHRRVRQDEWMRCRQNRLSFSQAEIVLLNSWIPEQQIVYHVLRVFVKTERLTDSANNSDGTTLSNYHIKTLMLWACELKPRSWWIDHLNIVRLLHTMGVWLTDSRCKHYFIYNCNLFDHPDYSSCSQLRNVASRLMSETEASLAEWFINSYIRKCAQLCPDNVSRLFDDVSNRSKLQKAVSAIVDWRSSKFHSISTVAVNFSVAQMSIMLCVSHLSLTVRSCLCFMRYMMKIDHRICVYFTSITFLHVGYKTTGDLLKDELLDVLATMCLQSNDQRRCRRAQHSSVSSLRQAAMLMKVVANNSRSTVQLIEIELSKAYLYRALRCKDSDTDSIYCLANAYLAVLYYITGQYQTAIDHCTLVTRSQGHSQCSSHVVQGELLPKIDDEIDSVLGLTVFYQYVRTAALNQQQQTQHVSVFTTELFAHYLHVRCLSVTKCRRLTQTSLTGEVQQYQKCFYELQETFTTDLLLHNFVNSTKYPTNDQRHVVVSSQTVPQISYQLDTSKLVELLQQSAIEHLTKFRQLEAQEFSSVSGIVTTDFKALYAYKCGEYERCLRLSTHNVRTLIGVKGISRVPLYPEFFQLMDDDIVSLIGLAFIVDPSFRDNKHSDAIRQLYLSLYLMTKCQVKLHHPLESLDQTLHYAHACLNFHEVVGVDLLLLKLTLRKIQLHIIR